MITDYPSIIASEDYQNDLSMLTTYIVNSLGDQIVSPKNPFVFVIANLVAIQRYFIRQQPQTTDIDLTPFLSLMQAEVGLELPTVSTLPMLEFIRENKAWYSHKGTETIYGFIGDLVGSAIEIYYPKELIITVSSSRTYVSGGVGENLAFADSKLGRIHDGIYWAQYVYVVSILQAQQIVSTNDLFNLLASVHPAGCKMFLKLFYNFSVQTVIPTIESRDIIKDRYVIAPSYPTVDNNWIVSGRSNVSMRNGTTLLDITNVTEIPLLQTDGTYRRMSDDTLMHDYITSVGPWAGFSRYISNNDGGYNQVYSDTDAIVYENVTTNVGIANYEWQDLENLTWQELQDAAWDLDQQNMRGMYMPNQLDVVVTSS